MTLDRRINAFRPDLADERLRGRIDARHFTAGTAAQGAVPLANLHQLPSSDSRIETQILLGEAVQVFDRKQGWAWVQCDGDGHVGYVVETALVAWQAATHRVVAPSTFLYPSASIKVQPAQPIYMGSLLDIAGQEGEFLELGDGRFVFAAHVSSTSETIPDAVAVAEQFVHVPYLWGGRSFAGIDCSGLVQLARQACGRPSLRDTDLQEQAGEALPLSMLDGATERGLLIFWPGHVAITVDERRIIHASGHVMKVLIEDRAEAIARIAARGVQVSSVQRI